MTNDEIKSLIETEKQLLAAFLRMAKRFQLPEEEVEKQTNFFLEKITELKQELKE